MYANIDDTAYYILCDCNTLTFAVGDTGRAAEVGRRVSGTPLAVRLTLLVLVVANRTCVTLAAEQVVMVAHITRV